MRKISLALVAATVLAVSALPAAAAGQKSPSGVTKHQSQAGQVDLSARRYYRGRYYRGGYRYGYRPYYRPYYAYGPGPYYGYGYYRPAPFPFFPFFF
jgi:Ni/Co efflux regulator RcnB